MTYIEILLVFLGLLLLVVIWRYPRRKVTLSHAIAVRTQADPQTVVIRAGAPLPYFFSDLFRNAEENQERVVISLLQVIEGREREIDVVTIEGLPPRPIGMLEMEIRLVLSRRKRLKVVVKSHDANLLNTYGPYPVE